MSQKPYSSNPFQQNIFPSFAGPSNISELAKQVLPFGQSVFTVFCDFDGTVSLKDCTDTLLSALASPEWETIEEEWVRGDISSRECLARQIPLIEGGWPAIQRVLDTIEIDPAFSSFAQWCRSTGIRLFMVSEGLDRVIQYMLDKAGIRVDGIFANHLVCHENGHVDIEFPRANLSGGCDAGLCKCAILENPLLNRHKQTVVIGDGRSDFCWSLEADVLFAKGKLLTHAQSHQKAVFGFQTFDTVLTELRHLQLERTPHSSKAIPEFDLARS